MRTLTERQLWYGVDKPPPETRELNAGPVTALLDGIDLRYVRIGSLEVVRRIYVAVRDQNWNTIPGASIGLRALTRNEIGSRSGLRLSIASHELRFMWQEEIVGSRDGQIRYEMNGVPKAIFVITELGYVFCIHSGNLLDGHIWRRLRRVK